MLTKWKEKRAESKRLRKEEHPEMVQTNRSSNASASSTDYYQYQSQGQNYINQFLLEDKQS